METKHLTLALQGGGSHGAFTWGVLDRLLEDGRVDIEAISGASAGAMNAVALACGYAAGGRDGAREALARLWNSIAEATPFVGTAATPAVAIDSASTPQPAMTLLLSMSRFFSPYQLNPFDFNPLREILVRQLDFDRLRGSGAIALFIAATQVRTGTLRLFRNTDLSVDAVLASACLPSIHRAIEIDGALYWDGALVANPPIFPLLHHCTADDIVMVLLHPGPRDGTPRTAGEIDERVAEIAFASSLGIELQAIELAKQEAARSLLPLGRLERRLRRLNLHAIDAQELLGALTVHSKLNTHPAFIQALYAHGRGRAGAWLEANFDLLGCTSSVELSALHTPRNATAGPPPV